MKQPRPGSQPAAAEKQEEAPASSSFRMPPGVADYYQVAREGVRGAGEALPHAGTIQRSFGRHDIGDVRATVGGAGGGAADALGAEAYTVGRSVAFSGPPSLHVAAHEAAHAVQQRAGVHLYGGGGDALERHADTVADRVVRGESAESLLDEHKGGGGQAVQCKMKFEGGAAWLDADRMQSPPPIFAWVQGNAKSMSTMVTVKEGTPSSGARAHYTFKQQSGEGEIVVTQRRYAGQNDQAEEQERSGVITSVTHETQHAVDDLSQDSPLRGEVAHHGQTKPDDVSRMEDVLSELHAHAVQAALTIKMNNSSGTIGDDLLAGSFRPSLQKAVDGEFSARDLFQKKLITYLDLYHQRDQVQDLRKFVEAHQQDVENILHWYDQLVNATSKKDLDKLPVNGLARPPQQQRGGMSPMAWGLFLGLAAAMIGYFAIFRS